MDKITEETKTTVLTSPSQDPAYTLYVPHSQQPGAAHQTFDRRSDIEYTQDRDYVEGSERHIIVNEASARQLHSHPQYDLHSYLPQRNTQASVIDQVRKWAIRYDDNGDPLAFIERVEELADVYAIPMNMLPRTMPELLKGNALVWFRHNKRDWIHWEAFKMDFLKFFLPHLYFERLEDELRNRLQKPGEPFKKYVLELQKLMRHLKLNEDEKLERFYRNSLVEYKMYVKRREFNTLDELIALTSDFESLRNEQKNLKPKETPMLIERRVKPMTIAAIEPINLTTACFRCGQSGHQARLCRNPRVLFCWQCGRRGVRTIDCCRKQSGNAQSIHGRALTAMIDTGPSKSFVRPNVVPCITGNITDVNVVVRLADGSPRHVNNIIDTCLQMGRDEYQVSLLVLDGMVHDIVLGMDFLNTASSTFCIGENVVKFGQVSKTNLSPVSLNSTFDEEQCIQKFLETELAEFKTLEGLSDIASHSITMKDDRLIKQRYYPRNPAMQKVLDKEIDELLKQGCIERSHSPYSSPVVLEIKYLGHLVTPQGIHTDPEKIAAIKDLPPPCNLKELRRCIGVASWYRRFVPQFSSTIQPLTLLLKKGKRWQWTEVQQAAFDELKEKLTSAPVLACPNFIEQFILQTDASDFGLGAILTQTISGEEKVIAYASRTLNPAEKNYTTTEKECLAIVWGV
ncbi:uncharacterized protein LOC119664634, partial [Teleopsis dalmanni]|uniref:uncharacterized protein LOC119664634 n=1 Tax=Teleopsis dalmanni TaxID=139649 RepID=UPI0018CC8622